MQSSEALLGVGQLIRQTTGVLSSRWRLFLGIIVIYGVLNIFFAQALTNGSDVTHLKNSLEQLFTGNWGALAASAGVFALMLTSPSAAGQGSGGYQLLITLMISLAVIWALRQSFLGNNVRVREAFYRGMYPLVPFMLILIVLSLELLPFIIGSTIYSIVVSNGMAVHLIEKISWLALFILLASVTLYLISSSIFALYIVTAHDMTPVKALRIAANLVRGRRWQVIRKILALPLILFLTVAVIMLPAILWVTSLAQVLFFMITLTSLVIIHTYLYVLYRGLLHE